MEKAEELNKFNVLARGPTKLLYKIIEAPLSACELISHFSGVLRHAQAWSCPFSLTRRFLL